MAKTKVIFFMSKRLGVRIAHGDLEKLSDKERNILLNELLVKKFRIDTAIKCRLRQTLDGERVALPADIVGISRERSHLFEFICELKHLINVHWLKTCGI